MPAIYTGVESVYRRGSAKNSTLRIQESAVRVRHEAITLWTRRITILHWSRKIIASGGCNVGPCSPKQTSVFYGIQSLQLSMNCEPELLSSSLGISSTRRPPKSIESACFQGRTVGFSHQEDRIGTVDDLGKLLHVKIYQVRFLRHGVSLQSEASEVDTTCQRGGERENSSDVREGQESSTWVRAAVSKPDGSTAVGAASVAHRVAGTSDSPGGKGARKHFGERLKRIRLEENSGNILPVYTVLALCLLCTSFG